MYINNSTTDSLDSIRLRHPTLRPPRPHEGAPEGRPPKNPGDYHKSLILIGERRDPLPQSGRFKCTQNPNAMPMFSADGSGAGVLPGKAAASGQVDVDENNFRLRLFIRAHIKTSP
jgi:hypothetical protein